MTPEDFARFLERLSPDMEEAGRRYLRLQKKLIGFFGTWGIADPSDAADETIERAALHVNAGRDIPNVERYCLGVARYIARERWREEQRERSVFRIFIEALDNSTAEEVERIEHILKPCFEELDEDEQKLLRDYCQVLRGRARAEHRRRLAEQMKTTVLALRIRVARLRKGLAECVRRRTESG